MNFGRGPRHAQQDETSRSIGDVLRDFRCQVTPRNAGVYIVWVTSVLASMTALYDLAKDYGGWGPLAALLFPVPVDIYWITGLNTALDSSLPVASRVKAALHAATALLVSVAGNILYHELHAKDIVLGDWKALTVGAISSVPLIIAAALTHLVALGRPATTPAGKARAKAAAAARKPRTTPAAGDVVHPGRATDGTASMPAAVTDHATAPAGAEGITVSGNGQPEPLKKGGRPDPIAVRAARDEWQSARRGGRIHSPRSLEKAVNELFGYPVIGRTSAASVIAEERGRRKTA